MAAAFTIDDILAATGGALRQRGVWDAFCGVSTDSRTAQTGQLFIPLAGERHDGHEFIPQALLRGARGVLVEKRILGAPGVGAGLKPAPTGRQWEGVLPAKLAKVGRPDLAAGGRSPLSACATKETDNMASRQSLKPARQG
jgi:UDP-N-acetylmuramyl pentapeptide synthase